MTTPRERITVECPSCGALYEDWRRRSINTGLGEVWTKEELREESTATCPDCAHVVELDVLVVSTGGVWTVEQPETAARPPLDLDSNPAGQDWIKRNRHGEEADDAS